MMNRRSELLLLRDRSRLLGVLIAALAVAATTALIYALKKIAPPVSLGVVYLLAVLLVSTYWGLWLGLATSIASAVAFNWFHLPPTGGFTVADSENWVALALFLATSVIASTVAEVARSTAADAQQRKEEADLSADMARTLLGGNDLNESLPVAAGRLADALGLRFADIHLGPPATGIASREPIDLDVGEAAEASLLVPVDLESAQLSRLRERVAPSLGALLSAALERDRLQSEVVETQALRRSDVMKTALLRAVSHDLRTPLTSIIAAADAVRSPHLGTRDRDELGALIGDEAGRLSRLVENLLDLSKLQAGSASPRSDWVSVEDVVRTAVEHLDGGEDAAPVHVSVGADLPLIEADAAQLERVFVNLLENARRFSGDHPVQVRLRVVGGHLKVRVVDRGPGIPARELAHVFEPFHQGADERDHAGSGLGLAIVKGFVEANGATVTAESLPGQGAVFAIDFPLEQ